MPIVEDLINHNRRLAALFSEPMSNMRVPGQLKALKPLFLSLLWKGLRTHGAVLTLSQVPDGENAAILVRSLFNLVVNTAWIWLFPEKRARRAEMFMDYFYVEQRRTAEIFEWTPDKPGGASVIRAADVYTQQIYEHAERVTLKHGYSKRPGEWSKRSLRAMSQEVGMEPHYEFIYQLLSASEHTTYSSTLNYLTPTADGVIVDPRPTEWMIPTILTTAFELLASLAEASNEILDLGLQDALDSAVNEFNPLIQLAQEKTSAQNRGP